MAPRLWVSPGEQKSVASIVAIHFSNWPSSGRGGTGQQRIVAAIQTAHSHQLRWFPLTGSLPCPSHPAPHPALPERPRIQREIFDMTGPNRRFFNGLSVRQKPLTGFGLVLTITQLVAALLIAQLIVVPLRQAVQQARKAANSPLPPPRETSAASIDLARWAGVAGRGQPLSPRVKAHALTSQTTGAWRPGCPWAAAMAARPRPPYRIATCGSGRREATAEAHPALRAPCCRRIHPGHAGFPLYPIQLLAVP
ncbi:hypothetical protein D3C76_981530 [compost metagenome]